MKSKKIYLPQENSFNISLIVIVALLTIFGLIAIFDSSVVQAYRDFGDSYYYIRAQLIWTVLAIFSAVFFAYFDYRSLKKLTWTALIISFLLLVAVFIPGLGTNSGGAQRWLNLGFLTIQPTEIFKLSAVLWLAGIFEGGVKIKHFLILVFLGVFLIGFLQRDLGSTIVFTAASLSIYFVAGGPLWQLFLGLIFSSIGFLVLIFTSEFRRKRIAAFLDPFSDPQGFTYHIAQVLIALGSGGFLGLGLGQSRQKFYIPEVTTDSIFAVVGEELGFLGGLFLIVLFAAVILIGFRISQKAPDVFGKLLAAGLTSWIGAQAVINLSATVALLPLTGVPLPFISYGGSALLVNMAAIGILLNISRKG